MPLCVGCIAGIEDRASIIASGGDLGGTLRGVGDLEHSVHGGSQREGEPSQLRRTRFVWILTVQLSLAGAVGAHAQVEAVRNGRAALATMLVDIKTTQRSGALTLFAGTDGQKSFGNAIDEDFDETVVCIQ